MLPESTLNLIVSGILTLAGVIFGVWLERHYHERKVRESLFGALFEEIKLNHSVVTKNLKQYKNSEWMIFDLSPLYTLAYQNIRTSGELSILTRNTLSLLEDTYQTVYAHNRQTTTMMEAPDGIMRDRGLKERLGKLEQNLHQLEQNFLRELKFLNY